jgi:hypothetical protein
MHRETTKHIFSDTTDPDYIENDMKIEIQKRYNKEIHKDIGRNTIIQ